MSFLIGTCFGKIAAFFIALFMLLLVTFSVFDFGSFVNAVSFMVAFVGACGNMIGVVVVFVVI